MYVTDAWIVLTVAPLAPLLVLAPFFIKHRGSQR